jgi:hypothetical protein
MASRPQQRPKPEPGQPGLKVVEKPAESPESAAKDGQAAAQARESEAASRRRLHPPRVWPD